MNKFVAPFYKEQSCVIAVSSSNEYAPYLCVYLASLKAHSKSDQKYDIVVFERNIDEQKKIAIKKAIETSYISVRFFNPISYFSNYKLHVTHDYFKEECFFRLVAPVIFKDYKKIIFTDLDIILNDDILELSKIDLQDKPMAAAVEPVWRYLYDKNMKILEHQIPSYTTGVLMLNNVYEYFNTGVCVFDVQKYNEENACKKILDDLQVNHYIFQEQCALNVFFKDKILKLPPIWNFELDPLIIHNYDKCEYIYQYQKYETEAKIFHFLGLNKPWFNAKEYKANIWWNYARQTPFYEEMLQNLVETRTAQSKLNPTLLNKPRILNINELSSNEYYIVLIFVIEHYWYFNLKKFWYKFKKAFAFGQRYQKYNQKYQNVKKLLKDARKLKKAMFHV